MQKKIARILIAIFALATIWGVFFFARAILEARPNDNLLHVPQDATFVARINGHKLLKDGFQTVILEEDDKVVHLLRELYERRTEDQEERVRLGIDFNSDIVLFDKVYDKEHIFGILLNLSHPSRFNKHIMGVLNRGQVASSRDNVGIILSMDHTKKSSLSMMDLRILADNILLQKSSLNLQQKLAFQDETSIARTWSENGLLHEGEIFNASNLNFDLKDEKLLITGDVKMTLHEHEQLNIRLRPKGIHLTAKAISTVVKDSLSVLFKEFNLPTGELCGVSMNYYGMKIVTTPKLAVVPHFDAILKFDNDFKLRPTLDSLHSAGDINLERYHFEYGGENFYWKQLSPNTIYLGLESKPDIINNKSKEVLNLQGDISNLTKVDGHGLFRQILEFNPKYAAGKSLSSKIRDCNLSVKRLGNNRYGLKGEIEFIDDQHAINSILSFLIESHIIN